MIDLPKHTQENYVDLPRHEATHEASGAATPRIVQCIECPHCGGLVKDLTPLVAVTSIPQVVGPMIAPMFDLAPAAELLGMSYRALIAYLKIHKDKFPPRYRVYEQRRGVRRRARVLSSNEILKLRTMRLRGPGRHVE